jgi:galactokinase
MKAVFPAGQSPVASHRRTTAFAVIAPGRVNLIGEHTDYNAGFVLPMAIEPHLRIEVKPRADRWMELRTERPGEPAVRVDLALPLEAADFRGSWGAYPCGVVAGLQRKGWEIPGFEALVTATLPAGGGLSSSAALEVGIATVLEELCGGRLAPEEKVLVAQNAEHEFAGVPCGIMDQSAVTYGRSGCAMLLDCRSRELRYVQFPGEQVAVLIVHSGIRHRLADGEYARRRSKCESAARLLGVTSLREVEAGDWALLEGKLPGVERRRARHVITENERTLAFVADLEAGDWGKAGERMYGSHASLAGDYEVSCQELDTLVEISRGIEGVFGCRMTGGGFGGCVVAMIESARSGEIREAFGIRYHRQTGILPEMFVTKPADGAAVLG